MKLLVSIVILIALGSCQAPSGKTESEKTNTPVTQVASSNPYYSRTDTTMIDLPDSVWKKVLSDSIFQVARLKATEIAFRGKYWNFMGLGTYYCAVCGNKLFRSDSKFSSNCGWPSFFEPSRKTSVLYQPDKSHGMNRIEVLCGRCSSHLGHLFDDGPPPTGKRYCMNSIILDFVPELNSKTF
jgi:peptide-methionine (R)-S-oxide reductase